MKDSEHNLGNDSLKIACFYKSDVVGQICPRSQDEGTLALGKYLWQEYDFKQTFPFVIDKADKPDIRLYRGDTRMYLSSGSLNFINAGGQILVVPQSYLDRYKWIDCFHITGGGEVDLSNPVDSAFIQEEDYRRFLKKIGWPGVERKLLIDFVNASGSVAPNDLLEFTLPIKHGTNKDKSCWKLSIGSHETRISIVAPFNSQTGEVRIVPVAGDDDRLVMLHGYATNEDGDERLVFTRQTYYGAKKLFTLDGLHSLTHFESKNTPDLTTDHISELEGLFAVFGAARAIDILYAVRPEFKGIPVETVKGVLSEYLGEFMMQRRPLNIPNIEAGAEFLSNPNFADALFEVMKDDCLEFVYLSRRENPNASTWNVISQYLASIRENTRYLGNANLDLVIDRVAQYYEEVLTISSPQRFVDCLRPGREFPDINQQIAIHEIMYKRRILNADIMGSGKSVTPLIAKELLGIDRVLVIVPNNVISTWVNYLSDNREGYYKSGMAPRVLIIDNIQCLNTNLNDYEFIIISQEKLNDRYTAALSRFDYKMLIVDEAHKLKNLQTGVRATHITDLASRTESEDSYLVLMSGTPVPNKIQDLAIYLKLLYPEKFRDVDNGELVASIINGDIVDLRSLLVPRMKRKNSLEGINLPDLSEETVYTPLSDYERVVYEMLLEEDELSASDKMRILRQFLLNPNSLNLLPYSTNSKAEHLGELLRDDFRTKKRISLFINGYTNGVIRGDTTIFEALALPDDVQVRIMDGQNPYERDAIQDEFNHADYPILLIVSGQTADVGRDFSGSEANYFYNLPWTEYDRLQQLYRAYREGRIGPLTSTTLVTSGTLEEGIHWYIGAKYKAVQKLLEGIPITQLEKKMIATSEAQQEDVLEVNPELAEYYFSTWDRMIKFFSYAREIGEEEFIAFLRNYGSEYAENYAALEKRSYYANANRVVGTLISNMVTQEQRPAEGVRILDMASGPEVLRKHVPSDIEDCVVSIDINYNHFTDSNSSHKAVGSFLSLPFKDGSFDYAVLSLAWHYTKFSLSDRNYERLEPILEANRVLQMGGRLIVNNIYSLDLKDHDAFKKMIALLGFRIVTDYSGVTTSTDIYKSSMYTLEKIADVRATAAEIVSQLDRETLYGVKFKKVTDKIKDSKRIISSFVLNGQRYHIELNDDDKQLLAQEQQIYAEAENLRVRYGDYGHIPTEVVIENGFGRIRIGKKYRIFKRLPYSSGVVVVR